MADLRKRYGLVLSTGQFAALRALPDIYHDEKFCFIAEHITAAKQGPQFTVYVTVSEILSGRVIMPMTPAPLKYGGYTRIPRPPCPKCGAPLALCFTKAKRPFLRCIRNPTCKGRKTIHQNKSKK